MSLTTGGGPSGLREETGAAVRSVALGCLLVLLFLSVSGCQRVAPPVKVGLVAPFEGRHRDVGYDAIYAARLAVREINANSADGAGALRLELVALDDSGDLQLARQAAASLVVDDRVVAVVGHWLPETTEAARPLYERGNLPLVALGSEPFVQTPPETLPASFHEAYGSVTPFEETPDSYAGATYDAVYLLYRALEDAETMGDISRASVAASLEGLQYEGLIGPVYWPQ